MMETKELIYLLLVAIPWIFFGTVALLGSNKKDMS